MALSLSDIKVEVVLLKAVKEIIDSIMNFEVLQLEGPSTCGSVARNQVRPAVNGQVHPAIQQREELLESNGLSTANGTVVGIETAL